MQHAESPSALGSVARTRPGLALFLSLLVGLVPLVRVAAQEKPASKTAAPPAEKAKKDDKATPESLPTDADKISRLQRSIDEGTKQVEDLRARIEAPDSEFAQAEAAFTELDKQLADRKKELESSDGKSDPAKVAASSQALEELTAKHQLAKERFDLAIRERKTLQEQLGAVQQKLAQDTEALRKAKGELPAAATQPTGAETVPPVAAPPAPNTTTPAVEPERTPAVTNPMVPAAAPTQAPAPVTGAEKPAAGVAAQAPAPEVLEARAQANLKQTEAKNARDEAESILDRISALKKSIGLEQKLFDTSRQKVENASATERTLYETLQRKWAEGAPQKEVADIQSQITEARARLRDAQDEMRQRTDRREQLQAELADLQAEHIGAMEEAARTQGEAEQAAKLVEHLESPLSPRNLLRWLIEHGPRVAGILVAMFVLLWVARLAENRIARFLTRSREPATAEDRENRAKTLVGVFHSAVTIVVYGGGGLMTLTEVGVNIIPLMGGAAVLGLAAAFGAQNLIRDYFYGFMILLENQYTINDVVKIGDVSGQVERITLRVTVLRGLDGTVHFVPNGEITRVSNMTHQWSRALFDIPVAYKEDVDRVMGELIELAKELRRDPDFRGLILEMPEMLGVDEFADSAVVIKFFIKTRPLKQWTVKRELLRRIKKRFDQLGIEIPFPQRTVYHRTESGATDRENLALALGREANGES